VCLPNDFLFFGSSHTPSFHANDNVQIDCHFGKAFVQLPAGIWTRSGLIKVFVI